MPKNPAIKRAARAYAAHHGVSYVEALRILRERRQETSLVCLNPNTCDREHVGGLSGTPVHLPPDGIVVPGHFDHGVPSDALADSGVVFCSECDMHGVETVMLDDNGLGHLCPLCDRHDDCTRFPCSGEPGTAIPFCALSRRGIGPGVVDGDRLLVAFSHVVPGDRIRFSPQSGRRWWTVKARDARYVIAVQQAPFQPKGDLWYTVVDLTGWTHTYNGVGPGVVRSSLNTLGGGWDIGPDGDGCEDVLAELQAERWELSRRRVASVHGIEFEPTRSSR